MGLELDETWIIYEDNHLLVVNKPAGILTQPSGTTQTNLEQLCKVWLKNRYHKPGNVFLEVIHRLDKPVSGLVVFAKTSKALARLQAFVRNKVVKKIYYARVQGTLPDDQGLLEHALLHEEHYARVAPNHPNSKIARLRYQVLDKNLKTSLLEIELETGRYHQIRVQLAASGCPILGDIKYGGLASHSQDSIALHYGKMQILHPITQNLLFFESPLPLSF